MVSNNWEDSTVGVITAEGTNVEVVEDFCYLSRAATYQEQETVTKNA